MMRRILSPRSSRPHRKLRRGFYGLAANIICNADDCSLPLSARSCDTSPLADRLRRWKRPGRFASWAAEVTAVTASPSESPRHFAASMDESVIVGYYTLKKCVPRSPRPSQIFPERSMTHGKK